MKETIDTVVYLTDAEDDTEYVFECLDTVFDRFKEPNADLFEFEEA